MFSETEVDLWSLSEFDFAENFRTHRADEVSLVWTPIHELGVSAVNVFSPAGRIFWSMDEHRTFESAWRAFANDLNARFNLRSTVAAICAEVGKDTDSVFAGVLLRGLTSRLGESFQPQLPVEDFALLDRRLISTVVPIESTEAVCSYFRRQVEIFGSFATKACDETRFVTILDVPAERLRKQPYLRLLETMVETLSPGDRKVLSSAASSAMSRIEEWRESQLEAFEAYDRGISLFVSDRLLDDSPFLEDFRAMAEFRMCFAERYYPVGALQGLTESLNEGAWMRSRLSELRELLLLRAGPKLAQYPIILRNPIAGR